MAEIGSWGTFTFYVSRSSIKTFDDLKWESSVKYATHERHLKEPLLEFTGQDVELSCIIGNLFTELDPPCAACDSDADELTISGRTYTGAQAVLTVTEWGFRFDGDPSEIEEIRGKRCLRRGG